MNTMNFVLHAKMGAGVPDDKFILHGRNDYCWLRCDGRMSTDRYVFYSTAGSRAVPPVSGFNTPPDVAHIVFSLDRVTGGGGGDRPPRSAAARHRDPVPRRQPVVSHHPSSSPPCALPARRPTYQPPANQSARRFVRRRRRRQTACTTRTAARTLRPRTVKRTIHVRTETTDTVALI